MTEPGARSRSRKSTGHEGGVALSAVAECPSGRPRVFAVPARVIRVSSEGGSSVAGELDAALLMTPRSDESFAMRVPRGSFGAGGMFILRCTGLDDERGAVARAVDVSELVGLHYDLVTAEIVQLSGLPGIGTRRDATSAERLAARAAQLLAASAASEPAQLPEEPDVPATRGGRSRLGQHASGSAVQLGGVATIGDEVSMALLTSVKLGVPITLVAARDEIFRGAYFSLRYFDAAGAKRGLLRADEVRRQPGMLDEIDATLIREPVRAQERQSYRACFDRFFIAEIPCGGGARTVRGRLTDLSSGGIGFRVTSPLAAGDRFRLADASLGDLDGAELIVVRRDPRDHQRYGAQFAEQDRGAVTLSSILGLDRSERERQRRLQVERIRRERSATAAPLSHADWQSLRNRRMRTRDTSET